MKKIIFAVLFLSFLTGCLFDNKNDKKGGGTGGVLYNISGTVKYIYTDNYSNSMVLGLPRINIELSGSGIATKETVSGTNGIFTFSGIPDGTYTLRPSYESAAFEPDTIQAKVKSGNVHDLSFILMTKENLDLNKLTSTILKGTVRDSCGKSITGLKIKHGGTSTKMNYSYVTDYEGSFTIKVGIGGNCSIKPEKEGYVFEPESRLITFTDGDSLDNLDFVGTDVSKNTFFSISGSLKDFYGESAAGIMVTLTGTKSQNFVTGSEGIYHFDNLLPGTYIVTPSKDGFYFNPQSQTISLLSANITGQDFIINTDENYLKSIEGCIQTVYGVGIAGVRVHLNNSDITPLTVLTGTDGHFYFERLKDGNYTLTPEFAGYTFNPPSKTVLIKDQGQKEIDFTGDGHSSGLSISGKVMTDSGTPIPEVSITIGSSSTTPLITFTESDGSYYLGGLDGQNLYTVKPSKNNYSFLPENATVSLRSTNQNNIDFEGTFIESDSEMPVSGKVIDETCKGVAGVTLNFYVLDELKETFETGSDGTFNLYKLSKLAAYRVIPEKEGFGFTPSYYDFVLSQNGKDGLNFYIYEETGVPKRSISGHITDNNGNGVQDFEIKISNSFTAMTDKNGYFIFENIPAYTFSNNGIYLDGYSTKYLFKSSTIYSPYLSGTLPSSSSDIKDLDIICSLAYFISGNILVDKTTPLNRVCINIEYNSISEKQSAILFSSNDGKFSTGLINYGNTSLKFSKAGYSFKPDSINVEIAGTNPEITIPDIVATKLVENQYYPLKTGFTRIYSKEIRDFVTKKTTTTEYKENVTGTQVFDGKTYWIINDENNNSLSISRVDGEFIYEYRGFGILEKTGPFLNELFKMAGENILQLFPQTSNDLVVYSFDKNYGNDSFIQYETINEKSDTESESYNLKSTIVNCLYDQTISINSKSLRGCIKHNTNTYLTKTSSLGTDIYFCETSVFFAKDIGIVKIIGNLYENGTLKKKITETLTDYHIN